MLKFNKCHFFSSGKPLKDGRRCHKNRPYKLTDDLHQIQDHITSFRGRGGGAISLFTKENQAFLFNRGTKH